MFNDWVVSPEAAVAIPGALRLFNRAKAAGVEVFFITGRPETQRQGTDGEPGSGWVHGWKGLDLRNGGESGLPTVRVQVGRSGKKIVDAGVPHCAECGGSVERPEWRAEGEVSVKMPNPFYFPALGRCGFAENKMQMRERDAGDARCGRCGRCECGSENEM